MLRRPSRSLFYSHRWWHIIARRRQTHTSSGLTKNSKAIDFPTHNSRESDSSPCLIIPWIACNNIARLLLVKRPFFRRFIHINWCPIEFYSVYYLCRKRPKSITVIPIYLPIDVYNAPLYVCVKCVRPFGSWSDRLLAPHDNGHSILFIPHIQSINMGKF
jgi:hypothetical protein